MSKSWNLTKNVLPRYYARVNTESMVVDVLTPEGWETEREPEKWFYISDPLRTENQQSISKWAKTTFGVAKDPATLIGRSMEEFAELMSLLLPEEIGAKFSEAAAFVASKLKTGKSVPYKELAEEMADVLIVLFQAAEDYGIDLLGAVDHKMQVNRDREWATEGEGKGQHV